MKSISVTILATMVLLSGNKSDSNYSKELKSIKRTLESAGVSIKKVEDVIVPKVNIPHFRDILFIEVENSSLLKGEFPKKISSNRVK